MTKPSCLHPLDHVDQFGCHACGTSLRERPDVRETYRAALVVGSILSLIRQGYTLKRNRLKNLA